MLAPALRGVALLRHRTLSHVVLPERCARRRTARFVARSHRRLRGVSSSLHPFSSPSLHALRTTCRMTLFAPCSARHLSHSRSLLRPRDPRASPHHADLPCPARHLSHHIPRSAPCPFVTPRLLFRALRAPSHHTLSHFALYAHRYIILILVSYALCALSHYTHRLAALLGAFAPARSAPHFALLVPGSTQTVVTSLV
ncbi:hypothetical protein K438DRAFT_1976396 [Mycena galopus ATCC 62051]|nr:hypothetical protein K438DRAFT_1976396 [Mycena galopus ATCC 62051]